MFFVSLIFNFNCRDIPDSHTPVSITQESQDTAVIAIIGSNIEVEKEINHWSDLKKTKNNFYIFADPSAKNKLNWLKGVSYFVEKKNLQEQLINTLNNINVKRLILFIRSHGAEQTGNFVYTEKDKLDEDLLINILKSQQNQSSLKQVLIAPTSCFNKLIMSRFAQKAKAFTWPFELAFLKSKNITTCTKLSLSSILLNNALGDTPTVPQNKYEEFFKINNLEKLVIFNNNLWDNIPAVRDAYDYELDFIKKSTEIKLDKFGFDIRIKYTPFYYKKRQVFPYNKTVKEIIELSDLDKKFYKNIESLEFYIETSPDYFEAYSIPVNGNIDLRLEQMDLEGKIFSDIHVYLSKNHPQK